MKYVFRYTRLAIIHLKMNGVFFISLIIPAAILDEWQSIFPETDKMDS